MGIISGYSDDAATTDSDKLLTYASDGTTKLTPASNINKYLGDGWTLSGDSWSYSSYNSTTKIGVINANSGANTKYNVGMWLKFTQPTLGVKYAKVTATTTTSITARFQSGTILSNEAITSPYFSAAAQPFGPSNTSAIDAQALYNPYKFNAYLASDQSISSTTWTKVTLNTENFDTGSNFDATTNYRFVAPIAGFYFLGGQVGLTAAGASAGVALNAAIYKNGTALTYLGTHPGNGSASSIPRPTVSGLYQLAASDYIEMYAKIDESGRAVGGGPEITFLSGFLVSAT